MSKSASNDKLVLTYFNGRGRAEGIRYLFAASGIKYEDNRLELGGEQWNKLKADMPFRQLPVLEINGQTVAESVAIGRYVAKAGDLYGSNDLEKAHIDSIVEKSTQFRESVADCFFMNASEDEKAKALEKYLKEKAAPLLEDLARYLADKDFFVGKKLSFADIWFYSCMELLIVTGKQPDYLKAHPKLQALYKRVEEVKAIADFIKKRPTTSF